MYYLLDTHIFLWSLSDEKKLSKSVAEIVKNPSNRIWISVASAWEISIKHASGKLPLKTTLAKCFQISGFEVLDIRFNHILQLEKLPKIHKDPFDRMLIAQAKVEDLTVLTNDLKFKLYNVPTIL